MGQVLASRLFDVLQSARNWQVRQFMNTAPVAVAPINQQISDETATQRAEFLRDAVEGLAQNPKTLPCKYFYDARGSQLFDQICQLDEYYVTRTEAAIMCEHGDAMARCIGPRSTLIEYGSGSSTKTRILLDALEKADLRPQAYLPLDISGAHLQESARALRNEYPDLNIVPICADYTGEFSLPRIEGASRRVAYFPGSTLGNFTRARAQQFLERMAQVCQGEGGALIGIDLKKDVQVLEAAYNDSKCVTANFNLNLLERINRELGGDFDVSRFEHRAIWDEANSRIEMQLIARGAQTVSLDGQTFDFADEEIIVTEHSHKYAPQVFTRMAENAGWKVREKWLDERELFCLFYLERR